MLVLPVLVFVRYTTLRHDTVLAIARDNLHGFIKIAT